MRPRMAFVLWLRTGDQPVRRASWLSAPKVLPISLPSKGFPPACIRLCHMCHFKPFFRPLRNRIRQHGRRNFIGRDAFAAMPALAVANDPAHGMPGIQHVKVGTPALGAYHADGPSRGRPALTSRFDRHAKFLRRSFWVYRFRCRPDAASPGALTPTMDAATAQPTRQSNQWLSGRVSHGDDSRTMPPGPTTSTHFSEWATCSASRCPRCASCDMRLDLL